VTTARADVAQRVRLLRNYGSQLKYQHVVKGRNSRLSEIQAAVLKVKLGKDRDKDKNLRDGEDICWAADMGKCAAGLCVLDSNCRKLSAWDTKKGAMIDAVPVGDLIGLVYPWPVALVSAKGVTYIGVTNKEKQAEDAPKDAKEVNYALIFRIKGLN
jgi:hypothetical protein